MSAVWHFCDALIITASHIYIHPSCFSPSLYIPHELIIHLYCSNMLNSTHCQSWPPKRRRNNNKNGGAASPISQPPTTPVSGRSHTPYSTPLSSLLNKNSRKTYRNGYENRSQGLLQRVQVGSQIEFLQMCGLDDKNWERSGDQEN